MTKTKPKQEECGRCGKRHGDNYSALCNECLNDPTLHDVPNQVPTSTVHEWETIYRNGARLLVRLQKPPKTWERIEPRDVIRITMRNKEYLGRRPAADLLFRPDEAHELINLLNRALQQLSRKYQV